MERDSFEENNLLELLQTMVSFEEIIGCEASPIFVSPRKTFRSGFVEPDVPEVGIPSSELSTYRGLSR